jgi:hypothetical protein
MTGRPARTSRAVAAVLVGMLAAACTTGAQSDPPAPAPASVSLVPPPQATDEPGDELGIVTQETRATITDPVGDVWLLRGTARPVRVRLPSLDLRRVDVRHGDSTVLVRLRSTALRPSARPTYDLGLRTAQGRFFVDLGLVDGRASRRPQRFVSPSGDAVSCPGLRAATDLTRHTVSVRVPRRCLGDPAWVSVRVLVSAPLGGGVAYENPHNSRPFSEFGTGRLYSSSG